MEATSGKTVVDDTHEGEVQADDPEILEMKKRVQGIYRYVLPLVTYLTFWYFFLVLEMENEHEKLNVIQKNVENKIHTASDNLDETSM